MRRRVCDMKSAIDHKKSARLSMAACQRMNKAPRASTPQRQPRQRSILDKVRNTACGIHHHATLPAVFGLAPPDRILFGLLETTCPGSIQDTAPSVQLGDIRTGECCTLVVVGQKHLAVVSSGLHTSGHRDPARLFLRGYGLHHTNGEIRIPRWLLIFCNRTPCRHPVASRLRAALPRRTRDESTTTYALIADRILARRATTLCRGGIDACNTHEQEKNPSIAKQIERPDRHCTSP